jgi:two-component system, chemotaxis family, sensor kinase Cph1
MIDSASSAPTGAWLEQPYSVKRHGVTITNCDSEPVQTPGCIQGHGALLVLSPGSLLILQASENAQRWFGRSAEELLGQRLAEAVGEAGQARLSQFLARHTTEDEPLYAFTLDGHGAVPPLDVSVHTTQGVVVVELESALEGGLPEPDYYALLKKSVNRLQRSSSLRGLCEAVSEEVRSLTGLDRVMVYKFHEDGHGEVFAESRRSDLEPWLGLHYPAEDIPQPAREIFRRIWSRPVPEVGAELAELVPLTNPRTGRALSMLHCALRGPSVMYTEYLQNMGVKAALTLSLRRGGELWGLIAGHHYAGPAHFSYRARAACELFAQVASLEHHAAEEREQLVYRVRLESVQEQLVARAVLAQDLTVIAAGGPTLLDAIDASGAALYHQQRWWRLGNTPSEPALDALAEWLLTEPKFGTASRAFFASASLARDYPPAAAYADVASGLLAIPLGTEHESLIFWFRPETLAIVNWGGNPHDKPMVTGPNGPRLTPRKSFELYVESVRQRALPWQPGEIDGACRLRLLLLEMVASQADRLATLNAALAQTNEELRAFAYVASHDLKEPLRGIHKYARELLEDALSNEQQCERLDRVLSLSSRMDGLLDSLLHFSRVGHAALRFEPLKLAEVLEEALEMVDSRRAQCPMEISRPRPLPWARGDRPQVREIFVNLLSNAMKYNDKATCRVEVGHIAPGESGVRGNAPAEAAEHTVYYVRDNGIGIDSKHHEQVFTLFRRLHARDAFGGGSGAGLTIVKKLVERHGGSVWLESSPGESTTFFFTLPCDGAALC